MKKLLTEFKEFISKGSIIDLAVAFIIGGAFRSIISSFVADVLMPVISLLLGSINVKELKIVLTAASGDIPELAIRYGVFIQGIIDFIIIAFVLFLIIKAVNRAKRKKEEVTVEVAEEPKTPDDILLLTEIRDLLKKE